MLRDLGSDQLVILVSWNNNVYKFLPLQYCKGELLLADYGGKLNGGGNPGIIVVSVCPYAMHIQLSLLMDFSLNVVLSC